MDGRFFGVPRGSRHPGHYYSVPLHRQPTVRSPRVVSIPVHFVEPEPEPEPMRMRGWTRSRDELVAKIQAAFRGFVVRKCVKKLGAMRREVEEIERRISEEEMAELIRRDERERLKVNEALMSLLFRLDSVRGVDAGVRELRKKVIRKAIALQEKVDEIAAAAADLANQKEAGDEVVQSEEGGVDSPYLPDQEGGNAAAERIDEQVAELHDREGRGDNVEQSEGLTLVSPDQKKEGGGEMEQSGDSDIVLPDQIDDGAAVKRGEGSVDNPSSEGVDHIANDEDDSCSPVMETEPALFESSGEIQSGPSMNLDSFLEVVDESTPVKEEDEIEEKEVEEEAAEEKGSKTNNRSEEMLGRMIEDNEKMMEMMTQLFERNERQTQMLSLLSQRVERLEKAFLCEKLRRKKRREATEGDRLPNSNKCGKKL